MNAAPDHRKCFTHEWEWKEARGQEQCKVKAIHTLESLPLPLHCRTVPRSQMTTRRGVVNTNHLKVQANDFMQSLSLTLFPHVKSFEEFRKGSQWAKSRPGVIICHWQLWFRYAQWQCNMSAVFMVQKKLVFFSLSLNTFISSCTSLDLLHLQSF